MSLPRSCCCCFDLEIGCFILGLLSVIGHATIFIDTYMGYDHNPDILSPDGIIYYYVFLWLIKKRNFPFSWSDNGRYDFRLENYWCSDSDNVDFGSCNGSLLLFFERKSMILHKIVCLKKNSEILIWWKLI